MIITQQLQFGAAVVVGALQQIATHDLTATTTASKKRTANTALCKQQLQTCSSSSSSSSSHKLNGSSSHVLTATSHSYGKAENSTPHRIETPNLIEMKFGTVDFVGEATPSAKFHANPSMGGFSANG